MAPRRRRGWQARTLDPWERPGVNSSLRRKNREFLYLGRLTDGHLLLKTMDALEIVTDAPAPCPDMLTSGLQDFLLIILVWALVAWAVHLTKTALNLQRLIISEQSGRLSIFKDVPMHACIPNLDLDTRRRFLSYLRARAPAVPAADTVGHVSPVSVRAIHGTPGGFILELESSLPGTVQAFYGVQPGVLVDLARVGAWRGHNRIGNSLAVGGSTTSASGTGDNGLGNGSCMANGRRLGSQTGRSLAALPLGEVVQEIVAAGTRTASAVRASIAASVPSTVRPARTEPVIRTVQTIELSTLASSDSAVLSTGSGDWDGSGGGGGVEGGSEGGGDGGGPSGAGGTPGGVGGGTASRSRGRLASRCRCRTRMVWSSARSGRRAKATRPRTWAWRECYPPG